MKKIILINLLFLLILTISIEAKGSKGAIGKSLAKVIAKSIPKLKKMITSSKRSKSTAIKAIKRKVPKITGVYKFKSSSGKPYIGKSVKTKNQNIQKRLIQHIGSSKLHPKDINSISYAKVSKKKVSSIEKRLIKKADNISNGKMENIHHAPKSRVQKKSIKERKDLNKEVLKNKSLLKTKF